MGGGRNFTRRFAGSGIHPAYDLDGFASKEAILKNSGDHTDKKNPFPISRCISV
jgi:hypothetical protein